MRQVLLSGVLLTGFAVLAPLLLLAQEGSLDPSFNPTDGGFGQGDGASGIVRTAGLQPDGKALIAGEFLSYNGVGTPRIARLLANGVLDSDFAPGTGANSTVRVCAIPAHVPLRRLPRPLN